MLIRDFSFVVKEIQAEQEIERLTSCLGLAEAQSKEFPGGTSACCSTAIPTRVRPG